MANILEFKPRADLAEWATTRYPEMLMNVAKLAVFNTIVNRTLDRLFTNSAIHSNWDQQLVHVFQNARSIIQREILSDIYKDLISCRDALNPITKFRLKDKEDLYNHLVQASATTEIDETTMDLILEDIPAQPDLRSWTDYLSDWTEETLIDFNLYYSQQGCLEFTTITIIET